MTQDVTAEQPIGEAAGLRFDRRHVAWLRDPGYDHNDDIAREPLVWVSLSEVTDASQMFVVGEHLAAVRADPGRLSDPLHLLRMPSGRVTVWDGHHRYTMGRLLGAAALPARVKALPGCCPCGPVSVTGDRSAEG